MNVEPPPEKPIQSSEEKDNGQEVSNEDQVIKVPRIDFIFGDCSIILRDSMQTIQIQRLMHLMVRSHIQAESKIRRSNAPFQFPSGKPNRSQEE